MKFRCSSIAELTREKLMSELSYNKDSGVFTRIRAASNAVEVGDIAGGKDRNGHIRISVSNRLHAAHRLAWLYVHGEWPSGVIDHINGDRADNRIVNLRDVPQSTNQQNQRNAHSINKTGLLGVTFHKSRGKFQAQIGRGKDHIYLELFLTAEEAHSAYLDAKRAIHEGCTI